MADNVDVTEGSGKTIATDDVGGAQFQKVKLDGGADGVSAPLEAGNGTAAAALRVTVASDSTGVVGATQSGTWNINNVSGTISLPTGASTAALQSLVQGLFGAINAERNVIYDSAGAAVDWAANVVVEGDGVAGTPAGGVLSVQGVAGGTTIPVSATFGATALTDGSSTITAGGTAQNAFAAAAVVNGYEIVNPDPSEDMWVSDTTTAAANAVGSIRVAANGGSYSSPTGMKPSAAVSVVAATTGHKFTARRW
jgi:hypothetical protein